jgi:hypothetical protein
MAGHNLSHDIPMKKMIIWVYQISIVSIYIYIYVIYIYIIIYIYVDQFLLVKLPIKDHIIIEYISAIPIHSIFKIDITLGIKYPI